MAAPSFLESMSPWTSRSTTPNIGQQRADGKHSPGGLENQQQGGDHTINNRHRLNLREYPDDCPPLSVRWYYAVDVSEHAPLDYLRLRFSTLCLGPEKEASYFKQTFRRY